MKKIFYIFFFISFYSYSQSNDSLKTESKNDTLTMKSLTLQVFVCGGENRTQYYSNNLFNYMTKKSYSNSTNKNIPITFTRSKSSLNPAFSFGGEMISRRHKKIHHLIEVGFQQFSGNYFTSTYSTFANSNSVRRLFDTSLTKFVQTAIVVDYKFQPTFKYLFLSFGVGFSFNLASLSENIHEEQIYMGEYQLQPLYTYSNTNRINNIHFIDFPFQIGGGGIIKRRNVVFKPAFYFTSCFIRGYNFYNLSLEILFDFKKRK